MVYNVWQYSENMWQCEVLAASGMTTLSETCSSEIQKFKFQSEY